MTTHVHGLTVTMLEDALLTARNVEHPVTLVDDATHTVVVVDLARRRSRPEPRREGAEVVDLDDRRGGRMTAHVRARDATWWADARCNDRSGQLAGIFFSGDLQDIARAKHICATCPVLVPCLEGAIERREPWGVWGGQLFLNGRIVAIKRRRGRPRKLPRSEDVLPLIQRPDHLRSATVAGDA
jgi:WhiB family transcriptional regulator, redox-sensing transcriptional regulator